MKLRYLREKNNMTQVDLAIALDVTTVTISNWENYNTKPRAHSIKDLQSLFGKDEICLDDFYWDDAN
jgi:transcriptional regulator with XRE-family HTH domain